MILDIVKNQPVIETHEMKVAQKYIGRIMGKGGESIKHIQAISNARIIVDSSMPSRDPSNYSFFLIIFFNFQRNLLFPLKFIFLTVKI